KNPHKAPAIKAFNNRIKTHHISNLETIKKRIEKIGQTPAEPTQPFFLKLLNKSKQGLIWFVQADWFGIEARDKQRLEAEKLKQRRLERQQRKEEKWKKAVAGLNHQRQAEEIHRRGLSPSPESAAPQQEQTPRRALKL